MTGSASVYLRAHQENRPALVGYFPVGHRQFLTRSML